MRALMPVISFGLSFWRGEPSMSTKGCLLVIGGFFIGTVGLVLFIALMATGFKDMHKNSIVIEGEGTCTVTLEKGDYTFFIEGTDNITPSLSPSDISVTDPSGASVTITTQTNSDYTLGAQKGKSVAAFKTDQQGEFHITTLRSEGGVLVLMKDFMPRMVKALGSSCAVFFMGGLAGLILVIAGIVTLVKERKTAQA